MAVKGDINKLKSSRTLTEAASARFATLGGQVESAMAALAPHYRSTSGTDLQTTMKEWDDYLKAGIKAFERMIAAIDDAVRRIHANEQEAGQSNQGIKQDLNSGALDFDGALKG